MAIIINFKLPDYINPDYNDEFNLEIGDRFSDRIVETEKELNDAVAEYQAMICKYLDKKLAMGKKPFVDNQMYLYFKDHGTLPGVDTTVNSLTLTNIATAIMSGEDSASPENKKYFTALKNDALSNVSDVNSNLTEYSYKINMIKADKNEGMSEQKTARKNLERAEAVFDLLGNELKTINTDKSTYDAADRLSEDDVRKLHLEATLGTLDYIVHRGGKAAAGAKYYSAAMLNALSGTINFQPQYNPQNPPKGEKNRTYQGMVRTQNLIPIYLFEQQVIKLFNHELAAERLNVRHESLQQEMMMRRTLYRDFTDMLRTISKMEEAYKNTEAVKLTSDYANGAVDVVGDRSTILPFKYNIIARRKAIENGWQLEDLELIGRAGALFDNAKAAYEKNKKKAENPYEKYYDVIEGACNYLHDTFENTRVDSPKKRSELLKTLRQHISAIEKTGLRDEAAGLTRMCETVTARPVRFFEEYLYKPSSQNYLELYHKGNEALKTEIPLKLYTAEQMQADIEAMKQDQKTEQLNSQNNQNNQTEPEKKPAKEQDPGKPQKDSVPSTTEAITATDNLLPHLTVDIQDDIDPVLLADFNDMKEALLAYRDLLGHISNNNIAGSFAKREEMLSSMKERLSSIAKRLSVDSLMLPTEALPASPRECIDFLKQQDMLLADRLSLEKRARLAACDRFYLQLSADTGFFQSSSDAYKSLTETLKNVRTHIAKNPKSPGYQEETDNLLRSLAEKCRAYLSEDDGSLILEHTENKGTNARYNSVLAIYDLADHRECEAFVRGENVIRKSVKITYPSAKGNSVDMPLAKMIHTHTKAVDKRFLGKQTVSEKNLPTAYTGKQSVDEINLTPAEENNVNHLTQGDISELPTVLTSRHGLFYGQLTPEERTRTAKLIISITQLSSILRSPCLRPDVVRSFPEFANLTDDEIDALNFGDKDKTYTDYGGYVAPLEVEPFTQQAKPIVNRLAKELKEYIAICRKSLERLPAEHHEHKKICEALLKNQENIFKGINPVKVNTLGAMVSCAVSLTMNVQIGAEFKLNSPELDFDGDEKLHEDFNGQIDEIYKDTGLLESISLTPEFSRHMVLFTDSVNAGINTAENEQSLRREHEKWMVRYIETISKVANMSREAYDNTEKKLNAIGTGWQNDITNMTGNRGPMRGIFEAQSNLMALRAGWPLADFRAIAAVGLDLYSMQREFELHSTKSTDAKQIPSKDLSDMGRQIMALQEHYRNMIVRDNKLTPESRIRELTEFKRLYDALLPHLNPKSKNSRQYLSNLLDAAIKRPLSDAEKHAVGNTSYTKEQMADSFDKNMGNITEYIERVRIRTDKTLPGFQSFADFAAEEKKRKPVTEEKAPEKSTEKSSEKSAGTARKLPALSDLDVNNAYDRMQMIFGASYEYMNAQQRQSAEASLKKMFIIYSVVNGMGNLMEENSLKVLGLNKETAGSLGVDIRKNKEPKAPLTFDGESFFMLPPEADGLVSAMLDEIKAFDGVIKNAQVNIKNPEHNRYISAMCDNLNRISSGEGFSVQQNSNIFGNAFGYRAFVNVPNIAVTDIEDAKNPTFTLSEFDSATKDADMINGFSAILEHGTLCSDYVKNKTGHINDPAWFKEQADAYYKSLESVTKAVKKMTLLSEDTYNDIANKAGEKKKIWLNSRQDICFDRSKYRSVYCGRIQQQAVQTGFMIEDAQAIGDVAALLYSSMEVSENLPLLPPADRPSADQIKEAQENLKDMQSYIDRILLPNKPHNEESRSKALTTLAGMVKEFADTQVKGLYSDKWQRVAVRIEQEAKRELSKGEKDMIKERRDAFLKKSPQSRKDLNDNQKKLYDEAKNERFKYSFASRLQTHNKLLLNSKRTAHFAYSSEERKIRWETENYKSVIKMKRDTGRLAKTMKNLRSHTLARFINSDEYNNFYDSVKEFLDSVNNNSTLAENSDKRLPDDAVFNIAEAFNTMRQRAKEYIDAKAAKKGGGIDKHYTDQGKDRLAMARMVLDLKLEDLGKEQKLFETKQQDKRGNRQRVEWDQLLDEEKNALARSDIDKTINRMIEVENYKKRRASKNRQAPKEPDKKSQSPAKAPKKPTD